jgi:hypothetical protein
LAGGNYSSPQGEYSDGINSMNDGSESGGYQRSNSNNKLGGIQGASSGDDWQWQDEQSNGNNTKS